MNNDDHAVAIVGVAAILPQALSAAAFWDNIIHKRYCIEEVPPGRWDPALYYDPDPQAPDKTYSKIGGWVRGFEFDWRRFRIPPKVAAAMDASQQWAVTIAADALEDYGFPERPLDSDRTAVVLGTAMGGEMHYLTHLRVVFPEFASALNQAAAFRDLPQAQREEIVRDWHVLVGELIPPITEDSMPGELPNIVSGRVANVLNLRGPNFITDAACASSFAAIQASVELLARHEVDAVITGGVDHNMGASSFVKFCKIGALSATGSRPFAEGADGFVMGEGAAAFLLKRLEDAERAGDRIYAVIRGVGGASDGKGKGITAPNPIGQELAIRRAWEHAGLDPATATLVEAHGTSTRVGDVVEVQSLGAVFGRALRQQIALGSAKSNIGHLKAGAGAAGLLKTTLALHHKVLPPTLNAETPNPNIDFQASPFFLNHQLRPWDMETETPRRAGVSAYGFGGTNFHLVLEEHVPGLLTQQKRSFAAAQVGPGPEEGPATGGNPPLPVRGILALGAATPQALQEKLDQALARVETGWAPPPAVPSAAILSEPERLVVDFGDHSELLDRLHKAQKAMGFDALPAWKAMQSQGIFRGSGEPVGKLAFLFPGQGSQYANMGRELCAISPTVAGTFAEADSALEKVLGKPLTAYIFVDGEDPAALMQAEIDLLQTEITQPAVLTLDTALFRLLDEYGFSPDLVMGHSLGEYAALIAAGVMPFVDAVEAAAARGSEMSKVSVADNGKMAAVLAPRAEVERLLRQVDGYVVIANINSNSQSVIGGASAAVEQAVALFEAHGYQALHLPVSHAFHTEIVAPASGPLRQVLNRLRVYPPRLPVVGNVDGNFYPHEPEAIKDILERQIASPVQWVQGLERLYAAGARTFVEVGPKRALRSFVNDVFKDRADVLALITNHPKYGALATLNQALCGLYAAGYGRTAASHPNGRQAGMQVQSAVVNSDLVTEPLPADAAGDIQKQEPHAPRVVTDYEALLPVVRQAVQQALQLEPQTGSAPHPFDRNSPPSGSVIITGTGLGLPGAEKPVMDPDNALRILRGEQFVDLIPARFRKQMVDKRIVRLVKAEDGSGSFATIDDSSEVIKLAGRPGSFDLQAEYGVPAKLVEALDITTQLAMAAGLDALREAGIPLVQTYHKTSNGKHLPRQWLLPEPLREETGVIFASAFPGGDRFADEFRRYYSYQNRVEQVHMLEDLRRFTQDKATLAELDRRLKSLRVELEAEPYVFDRRFLFRILSMGHSQFAQYIGARGPNTQVNAACASTTQALALAEDWIREGRCRRVIVISADNVTGDNLMEWVGAGFLAVGAVTTADKVEEAALPFDRRRHGTILGMGACALVVESEDAVRERGMRGIVELLASESNNSAYHGTRLDVEHIALVMENLMRSAERRFGIDRQMIAPRTVFVSHETFTPARGGSAAAEVVALRRVFGSVANEMVVANTKGFTGHPMGVGIEDVLAVKMLEHGLVPPLPNFKEVDPELGTLNFSRGGRYPIRYALHLAAGFGSQIALSLIRRIPGSPDRVDHSGRYRRWLADVSGYNRAETEIVQRVLRIKDQGRPERAPALSAWQYGTGPAARVPFTSEDVAARHVGSAPPSQDEERGPAVAEAPVAPAGSVSEILPSPTPVVLDKALHEVNRPPLQDPDRSATEVREAPVAVDTVAARVLSLVAEQTGYPEDMLDLDLDLEADLGIDTVKQAETFAAIREAFGIPQQDNLRLGDYTTLEKVIGFVRQMRPDLGLLSIEPTGRAPAVATVATEAAQDDGLDAVAAAVLAIVAAQTGYPEDMLDLDLDLEADLGVDTVKQAETFVAIREAFDIPRRDDLHLGDYNTLEKVIGFVREMRPDLTLPAPAPGSRQEEDTSVEPVRMQRATPAPAASGPVEDEVVARILALVADQTGYPEDMLELDLDLEADLGIDTVKQAEIFAALREAFDIPRRDDLRLGDYNTLQSVIDFIYMMRPDLQDGSLASSVAVGPPEDVTQQKDTVAEQILALVADQTGYPQDMLDLDLDLEADLGVDTVKQAETFAAIREAFNIPRRDDLKLGDYNTLEKVIEFVYEMRPELRNGGERSPLAADPFSGSAGADPCPAELEAADRVPRRVPRPTPRPPLELCVATGVTLGPESRVIVALDQSGVGRALVRALEERRVVVLVLDVAQDGDEIEAEVQGWLEQGPVNGVYWLPALDPEPGLDDMELSGWRELNRQRVKNLAITMRVLYESIADAGSFLVAGTRLGGSHGYDPAGASNPVGGGVAGFVKAYKRERPDALVKVVDFPVDRKQKWPVEALLAETRLDPGVIEVGYPTAQNRVSITLVDEPVADGAAGLELGPETVFLVTGAAGGITSAIVGDLAAASGGTFFLVDLVPEPDPRDRRIARFRADREGMRADLIAEARAEGLRPTPVEIEKALLEVERAEAALQAIEAVRQAGGQVTYRSGNLLDTSALSGIVDEIRTQFGRIDVLIHAGGIEISRSLDKKEQAQFERVYDVKADGFFNLLSVAKDLPIAATVAFSSVAGRFGNSGQTDYSAANDLLCKVTSHLRRWRPETRGIVIDWTAWADIGMATRGTIPKIMALAGIEMLPAEVGVPTVRRELTSHGFRGELVVAGALGLLMEEWHPTGGLDLGKANAWLAQRHFPLLGEFAGAFLYRGVVLKTRLDPQQQPFLHDHALDGTPLLPGVMGIEAFAEIAALLVPGNHVQRVTEIEFRKPFKFYRMESQTLYLDAHLVQRDTSRWVARTTLRSRRQLPKSTLADQELEHFVATVTLATIPPEASEVVAPPAPGEVNVLSAGDIYRVYFHGPAYRVLQSVQVKDHVAVGQFTTQLPVQMHPAGAPEHTAPRLLELCFQTAGVWEMRQTGRLALPAYVGEVITFRREAELQDAPLYAIVEAIEGGARFNASVVDAQGRLYLSLRDYRTVALPGTITI